MTAPLTMLPPALHLRTFRERVQAAGEELTVGVIDMRGWLAQAAAHNTAESRYEALARREYDLALVALSLGDVVACERHLHKHQDYLDAAEREDRKEAALRERAHGHTEPTLGWARMVNSAHEQIASWLEDVWQRAMRRRKLAPVAQLPLVPEGGPEGTAA